MSKAYTISRVGKTNWIKISAEKFTLRFPTFTVTGRGSLLKRPSGAREILSHMQAIGSDFVWVDNDGKLPVTYAIGIRPRDGKKMALLKKVMREINGDYVR